MTIEKLIHEIWKHQPNVQNGEWLKNTAKLIREYDEQNPNSSLILLLGAGDVDGLRYEIL
jgi:UDP-N-acetylmuramate-alanine ligase